MKKYLRTITVSIFLVFIGIVSVLAFPTDAKENEAYFYGETKDSNE